MNDLPEPGSDSASPAVSPDLELPWRRLHPLSPLLRGGLVMIVVFGIIVTNLRDRLLEIFIADEYMDAFGPNEGDLFEFLIEQRLIVWALLGLIAVILIIVGFSWLVWRYATFRITAEAVESRWGVVFKQHRRAPLERIQSVNLQRSLLARIFGLTQVEVQTAGQDGKVALQYLGHRDAKQVREQILRAASASRARRAGLAPNQQVAQASAGAQASVWVQDQTHAQAVDPSGNVYSGATHALEARAQDLIDFDIDPEALRAGSLVKVPIGRLLGSILLSSEMFVLLILVAVIVVSSVLATPFLLAGLFPTVLVFIGVLISHFNRGFNFVLSRTDDGVRVGAGLTSTTTETVPFGRVHAVEAQQPLAWRPFGWWKMRITTAGHSAASAGQNKLQNTVLPVGKVDDVLRVFETLLHGEPDGKDERDALIYDALVGEGRGFLNAGPRSGAVLLFAKRRAGVRIEAGHGEDASLRIRRGWLTRTLCVMPILRAQSVQLTRPFMHRILGLATLQAHTVLGPVRMQVRGLKLEDARQAFDVLAKTVVTVQGAEADLVASRSERHS